MVLLKYEFIRQSRLRRTSCNQLLSGFTEAASSSVTFIRQGQLAASSPTDAVAQLLR